MKNWVKLMMVPYINSPPTIDITMAGIWIRPVCASRTGKAVVSGQREGPRRNRLLNVPMPIITKNPVEKRPRSIQALELLSIKSSGFAHLEAIQFGTGANTYVATTSRVRKLWKRAAERMTSKKPIARTWIHINDQTLGEG